MSSKARGPNSRACSLVTLYRQSELHLTSPKHCFMGEYSEAHAVDLPHIQHSRALSRRKSSVTVVAGIIHEVVDRVGPTVPLRSIRVRATHSYVALWGSRIGTGVFVRRATICEIESISRCILERKLQGPKTATYWYSSFPEGCLPHNHRSQMDYTCCLGKDAATRSNAPLHAPSCLQGCSP